VPDDAIDVHLAGESDAAGQRVDAPPIVPGRLLDA